MRPFEARSPAAAAVEENSEFRLSERSRCDAAAARALGVLDRSDVDASTIVRSPRCMPAEGGVTRRGGSGSRPRLSGTWVRARTSSMETSFGGVTLAACAGEGL